MEIQRKTMHLGINRAVGHRDERRFDLSMESKMNGNSKENNAFGAQSGCGRESAKTKHRFDFSMGNKMCGNSKENYAFGDQSGCGTARIRKN